MGKRSQDAILNRPYDFSHVSLRKSHKVIRKTALARTDFIGRRISVSFKIVVKQRRAYALRDACPFAINIPVCHLSAIARPRLHVISLPDCINLSCVGKNN